MSYLAGHAGTRLYYQEHGERSSGRASIVLLSSWSFDSTMWERQVHTLATAGVHCLALDRRGHGRSDRLGADLLEFHAGVRSPLAFTGADGS